MNSIDPHHLASIAALVVCLIGIGLLAHWLDKQAQRRKASTSPPLQDPIYISDDELDFLKGLPGHEVKAYLSERKSGTKPAAAMAEHHARIERLRNWSRLKRLRDWSEAERISTAHRSTQTPPKPAPARNPGPGLRPHPVYGDQPESRGAWVIPPADLLAPIITRGEGDCFNPTIPGADWKPAGGEFGGGGASGTWDTPSTDTATTASTAE